MRNRKLSREKALQEYVIYQIRVYQFLHMFLIGTEILEGRCQPGNLLGHGPNNFFDSVRDMQTGLFASLMEPDTSNHALNIFDVWLALFPSQEKRILDTWEKIKPHMQLVREYRNEVAFHANKDLKRYFKVLRRFKVGKKGIAEAMQAFLELATELIRNQTAALPDLRAELDPILRKALPDVGGKGIERFIDYLHIHDGSMDETN